jgi:hypothetical protein
VYWPKEGKVTVERNVRFVDGSTFEGEKVESVLVSNVHPSEDEQEKSSKSTQNSPEEKKPPTSNLSTTPTAPNASQTSPVSSPMPTNAPIAIPDPLDGIETEEIQDAGRRKSTRTSKPSIHVQRILADSGQVPIGMRPSKTLLEGNATSAVGARGHAKLCKLMSAPHANKEPRSLGEAKLRPDAQEYIDACISECNKLKANGTWKYIPRDQANNVLPVKWVFDTKFDGQHVSWLGVTSRNGW